MLPGICSNNLIGDLQKLVHFRLCNVDELQVQDAKVLLNTLITGFKHLLYSIVNFGNTSRQPPTRTPVQPPLASIGLREDEVRLTTRLLTCGVKCLKLYTKTSESKDGMTNGINNYADVFAVLSVRVLLP